MHDESTFAATEASVPRRTIDVALLIGLGLLSALLTANAALGYRNTRQLKDDASSVAQTHEVQSLTAEVLLAVVDAETGQRGFLITGKENYLEPYRAALARLDGLLTTLREKTKGDDRGQERVLRLSQSIADRIALLKQGIELRRRGAEEAIAFIAAGKGKVQMDLVRLQVAEMIADESELLRTRERQSVAAYRIAIVSGIVGSLAGLGVVVAFIWLLQRSLLSRQRAAARLHEQREWFRTTLACIGDGVIATDKEGRVTLINAVAQALTGWAEQDARGQPLETVFRIVNESTRRAVDSPALRALKEGAIVGLANHTVLISKTGHETPIDDSAAPIRDEAGRITGAVLIFRDVAERRELENKLRAYVAELSEADRRKNEFLAMLAHELRNPLAPIRNAMEILRLAEGDGRAVAPTIDVMQRQVGQMVRLIDDLLDVSRISRGKIALSREAVDLASVLEQAVEAARPHLDANTQQLHFSPPKQAIRLHADPVRLTQAIGNLLNNAAKFTEPGGSIWLSAELQGDQAVVRIRDSGIGIAADQLPYVFDMFVQVDTSLERSRSGLGIGLTLVKKLVESHGGTVEAHSEGLGKGSEFVVRLPALIGPPPSQSPKPLASEAQSVIKRRVLIVDDNIDAAESLAMLLRIAGHEVQTAHDGVAAVAATESFGPDAVLLDIGLPKLNGYEAAQRIRGQPWGKGILLAALTGWGQEADRLRSAAAGFDAHLVKPVDFPALTKLLTDLTPK